MSAIHSQPFSISSPARCSSWRCAGFHRPQSSRAGNTYGMVGMAIAILTTLAIAAPTNPLVWVLIIARHCHWRRHWRVSGTAHCHDGHAAAGGGVPFAGGLAAVFVAAAAFYAPDAFGIATDGVIHAQSRIEMALGAAIGAITFTGSIIAFLKLDGRMSGAPIMLPVAPLHQSLHLALALVFFIYEFFAARAPLISG